MKISHLSAHEIISSGGFPTIEVEVTLDDGSFGKASVPYGASAGSHEAVMLNDGDESRYSGKGVLKAVENVKTIIAPELVGMEASAQQEIDHTMIELDGTENKSRLGGNAILGVSLAVARAVAHSHQMPFYKYIAETFQTGQDFSELPHPMAVVIEGGKHADETTDLQEYCMSALRTNSPKEGVRRVLESYHQLKKILKKEGLSTNVGNEGAFAPNGIPSNESPFNYIVQAIEQAGYKPGEEVGISVDAAASEFFENGAYHLKLEKRDLSGSELSQYYQTWMEKYPIVTLEDMHHEDDWDSWVEFNQMVKAHGIELIGDDLTVTNIHRLQKAIDLDAITAILIKLNQIGSLTETVETCMLAKQHQMMTVTSHRGGGETNDTAIVDLAVAVGSRFIKVGPSRGERVSKYNRLMEIERELTNNT